MSRHLAPFNRKCQYHQIFRQNFRRAAAIYRALWINFAIKFKWNEFRTINFLKIWLCYRWLTKSVFSGEFQYLFQIKTIIFFGHGLHFGRPSIIGRRPSSLWNYRLIWFCWLISSKQKERVQHGIHCFKEAVIFIIVMPDCESKNEHLKPSHLHLTCVPWVRNFKPEWKIYQFKLV